MPLGQRTASARSSKAKRKTVKPPNDAATRTSAPGGGSRAVYLWAPTSHPQPWRSLIRHDLWRYLLEPSPARRPLGRSTRHPRMCVSTEYPRGTRCRDQSSDHCCGGAPARTLSSPVARSVARSVPAPRHIHVAPRGGAATRPRTIVVVELSLPPARTLSSRRPIRRPVRPCPSAYPRGTPRRGRDAPSTAARGRRRTSARARAQRPRRARGQRRTRGPRAPRRRRGAAPPGARQRRRRARPASAARSRAPPRPPSFLPGRRRRCPRLLVVFAGGWPGTR